MKLTNIKSNKHRTVWTKVEDAAVSEVLASDDYKLYDGRFNWTMILLELTCRGVKHSQRSIENRWKSVLQPEVCREILNQEEISGLNRLLTTGEYLIGDRIQWEKIALQLKETHGRKHPGSKLRNYYLHHITKSDRKRKYKVKPKKNQSSKRIKITENQGVKISPHDDESSQSIPTTSIHSPCFFAKTSSRAVDREYLQSERLKSYIEGANLPKQCDPNTPLTQLSLLINQYAPQNPMVQVQPLPMIVDSILIDLTAPTDELPDPTPENNFGGLFGLL